MTVFKNNNRPLVHFLFELGMMKKIEHCGTKFAGVKYPDSIAEHTCCAAQIGYAIACAENGDPEKVSAMCIFHDVSEIRVGDIHRIASRYIKSPKDAENKAFEEQTENLPEPLKKRIRQLWNEYFEQKTLDSKIARDADLLETILQAKEYLDTGYRTAQRWLDNGGKYLSTKTAKQLFKEILNGNFSDWWDHLNKV